MRRYARILLIFLGVMLAAAPAGAQRETQVPQELLDRVADWTERFLADFPHYAAEEALTQTKWDRSRRETQRHIVSQYLVLRLPSNPRELAEFRDVIAVDGKVLQTPEEREAKWPRLAAARTRQELDALVEDPIRHRISPEHFASLGLLVSRLARRHHDKMRFFFPADVSDVVSTSVLIGYRQNSGPGLIEVERRAVYPSGNAWVEPDDGHVVRMEERFEHKNTIYTVAVDFVEAGELNTWVPGVVTVRIFERGRLSLQDVYTYSNFRPLAHTETTVAVP